MAGAHAFLPLLLLAPVLGPPQRNAPTSRPAESFDHEHTALSELLRDHVRDRGVDYVALKKDRAGLERYVSGLEHVDRKTFEKWSDAQQYAFWINAYNAYTLARVLDHYPVRSIRDIGDDDESVWDQRFIPLGHLHPKERDRKLTLNEIEHEILRPRFRDPRVHAAVNCASVSCPPLRDEAYRAKDLERQLDEQARAWLADTSRNRLDAKSKTVHLSRVFEWFEDDFEDHGGGVLNWVARHAPASERDWIRGARVEFLEYSWKLNDASR